MDTVLPTKDACYRAVASRDSRFDGWFYTGVTSTGIYCRPSCPAITPRRKNVTFFSTAAGAQQAGFRACLRCRPDAAPGSPEWNYRTDLVGRAMRLIGDGVVDRGGVDGLAQRLGYSVRHVHRTLGDELGVGPLALARAQRAQTARTLIESSDLSFSEVAFASGFASIRQFNDTTKEIYGSTPSQLRERAQAVTAVHRPTLRHSSSTAVTTQTLIPVTLRLAFRAPLAADELWTFLAARAVTGVEHGTADVYRRALQLPHGVGLIELNRPGSGQSYVWCTVSLADLRDLTTAVRRCRRLLDLDADPVAVAQALSSDPGFAAALHRAPGLRLPGACDPAEYAIRAVIGQQISVAAARTVTGRICAHYGSPLTRPDAALTHTFPVPEALAEADPADLPMPLARKRTLRTLCTALADGTIALDVGSDPAQLVSELTELPGIGPWTANYIAMRGLGAPDIFLETDLGVLRGAAALGLPATPRELLAHAERWHPWRSYAVLHLWHTTSNTYNSTTNKKEATQ